MSKNNKTTAFEDAIQQLENIVTSLETGDLSLEESLVSFEKGIKLTHDCQKQLNEAEHKIALLIGEGDDMQLIDFDQDAEQNPNH
jgi:exodeoxyribonuclease VII small subunit